MIFNNIMRPLTAAAFALAALAFPSTTRAGTPSPWNNFNNNPIFYADPNATSWRTLYSCTVQHPDKSILLSWEGYDPRATRTYFPIWKSTDGGASFTYFSRVDDQINGWGNWYQPFLYLLPQDLGGYPKGTILLAGVSTPRDLRAAYIDLYASTNEGRD
jgi:hypothetical protein